MSGVFYLTYILQFIVHRLYHRTFSEQQLIIQAHQGVLHVLLYLGHQMYIVHKEHLKEVLTDIPPVCEEFSKQPLGEAFILQWLPVIYIAWRELPLDNLSPVIDDKMELEAIEPTHRALSLCRPASHGSVLPLTLDVTGSQWCGINDGYARTLAQCTCLEKQQQV